MKRTCGEATERSGRKVNTQVITCALQEKTTAGKKADCVACPLRPQCRDICPDIAEILSEVERHFQGREILVDPATISAAFSNGNVRPLGELMPGQVSVAELEVIPGLTERQLCVLILSVVERLSQRRIAMQLGLCQSTVGEHLNSARKKARRYIESRRKV